MLQTAASSVLAAIAATCHAENWYSDGVADLQLRGSKAIVAANDRFDATMTNIVTWEGGEAQELKHLCSNTSIQVALEVPRWARMVPTSAIESTGSRVMQTVLNSTVPKFLKQLQKDYELWAAGDESRKPIGTGEL